MRTPLSLILGLVLGFAAATTASCGGSRACTPTTCPTGCCSTSGLCEPGSSGSACGSRGSACTSCGVTATCVAGTCMQGGIGSSGGGSSGTGGGTAGGSGTGGGSAGGATAFCARLEAAMNRFFAGRSMCSAMGFTLSNGFNTSACLAGYASCTSFDVQTLNTGTACIEMATICTSGNDQAALQSVTPCLAGISDISPTCAAAMGFSP